jgi:hypothetical protein
MYSSPRLNIGNTIALFNNTGNTNVNNFYDYFLYKILNNNPSCFDVGTTSSPNDLYNLMIATLKFKLFLYQKCSEELRDVVNNSYAGDHLTQPFNLSGIFSTDNMKFYSAPYLPVDIGGWNQWTPSLTSLTSNYQTVIENATVNN